MITNHKAAKEILEKLESSIRLLNEVILIAQHKCDSDEYETFKKEAGVFIGNIDYKLIMPIHNMHPDLAPEAIK